MIVVIHEALLDSLKMLPFLLGIYLLVAWMEFNHGQTIREHILRAGKTGPLLGALFGSIPQCGFSVMGSALYTRGLISTGTLLAVFLATSDEAVPVILARPEHISIVIPLVLTKVVVALLAGFGIDWAVRRALPHPDAEADDLDEHGCCDHHISGEQKLRALLWHPLIHTARVFAFVLAITLVVGLLVKQLGIDAAGRYFLQHSPLQPILAALVGLIPNCAVSVAITQFYLLGSISFGSAIAGLCAGAGFGAIVLFKENLDRRDTLRILGLLLLISSVVGIIIQWLEPVIGLPIIK